MKKLLLILTIGCCMNANAALRGDVDGNGIVNVSDVTALINQILGTASHPSERCDISGDGIINVSDVTALSNIILSGDVQDTHKYVDLGLPGGVLWATCNIGAESPEDYGLYFAWGETTGYAKGESHSFDWANYKWMTPGKSSWEYLTKYTFEDGIKTGKWYNGDTYVGTTVNGVTYKNLTELLPEDDAATANWGAGWRMPTKKEIEDLCNSNYTTTELVTVNGVKGRKITSKSNDNSIFLPAAGYRYDTRLYREGSYGGYWSSSLSTSYSISAYYLSFLSSSIDWDYDNRYFGQSVRAVRVKR